MSEWQECDATLNAADNVASKQTEKIRWFGAKCRNKSFFIIDEWKWTNEKIRTTTIEERKKLANIFFILGGGWEAKNRFSSSPLHRKKWSHSTESPTTRNCCNMKPHWVFVLGTRSFLRTGASPNESANPELGVPTCFCLSCSHYWGFSSLFLRWQHSWD